MFILLLLIVTIVVFKCLGKKVKSYWLLALIGAALVTGPDIVAGLRHIHWSVAQQIKHELPLTVTIAPADSSSSKNLVTVSKTITNPAQVRAVAEALMDYSIFALSSKRSIWICRLTLDFPSGGNLMLLVDHSESQGTIVSDAHGEVRCPTLARTLQNLVAETMPVVE